MGLGTVGRVARAAPTKGAEDEARKANRDRFWFARRAAHGRRGALQGFVTPQDRQSPNGPGHTGSVCCLLAGARSELVREGRSDANA